MRVKALVSFKGRVGPTSWHVVQGEELELPQGVDWLTAGLVEAVEAEPTTAPAPHLAGVEKAIAEPVAEKRKKG